MNPLIQMLLGPGGNIATGGGATPPIIPPTAPRGTQQKPAGLDGFLSGNSGQFLMNLLAQDGFSTMPQSALGAVGRAGLAAQQQGQQQQMTDLQRKLIESRIGLNQKQADAAGQQAGPRVQSSKTLANGNVGLVFSNGEIKDSGIKEAGKNQLINVPGLGLLKNDPVTGTISTVGAEDIIQSGLGGRAAASEFGKQSAITASINPERISRESELAGARQAASTAAQESTQQQFQLPKRVKSAQITIRKIDNTLDEANRALGLVSDTSTGIVGSFLDGIPGTDAFALSNAIKPLKAALSFDTLSEMKASSPSGGALGQVSERELDLLGAALTSLDQAQRPGDVKRALKKVVTHYENWRQIVSQDAENLQGQQAGDVSGFRIVQ